MRLKKYLQEGKNDYIIYHSTYSACVSAMLQFIQKNGYLPDEDDIWTNITTGPAKPSKGKTNSLHLDLYKKGKKQKKQLHAQVYNRGVAGNTFELNMYIQ